jgi:hypothetical protein
VVVTARLMEVLVKPLELVYVTALEPVLEILNHKEIINHKECKIKEEINSHKNSFV